MNKLGDVYYKAIVEVLENRELLLKRAEAIAESMLEAYTFKLGQLKLNSGDKLDNIRHEISRSSTYLENPAAVVFTDLMRVSDIDRYLATIQENLLRQNEDDLRFDSESLLYTHLKISVDKAEDYINASYDNPKRLVKEIKFCIVEIWAYHNYTFVLRASEQKLQQAILEKTTSTPYLIETAEQSSDQDSKNGVLKKFTNPQKVLAIMLLNKVYKINKSQEVQSLNNFIHALTGNSWDDITKFARLADKDNFMTSVDPIHSKKNLRAVRPFFEKLEQEKVIELIDAAIAYAESKIRK